MLFTKRSWKWKRRVPSPREGNRKAARCLAIALPLQRDQAKSLAEHSVQAPFGRGADTVVDTAVRLCRQVEPAKIRLGAAWNAYIQKCAAAYVDQLGVSNDNVEARLYKLVLYEEGGFFKSHKDTEKEPGMFGSLVVQLPAKHDAGTLEVRHRGEEILFDFSNDSNADFYGAAFYTDVSMNFIQWKMVHDFVYCTILFGWVAMALFPHSRIMMHFVILYFKSRHNGKMTLMHPRSFVWLKEFGIS
jgi:hypothetical protein